MSRIKVNKNLKPTIQSIFESELKPMVQKEILKKRVKKHIREAASDTHNFPGYVLTNQALQDSKKSNDEAKLKEENLINSNNKKILTEEKQIEAEKTTSEIEIEAENINQTTTFRQKQLDIKDEDISPISANKTEIEKIDNNIKNKTKIREAIEAGTYCTKRNS